MIYFGFAKIWLQEEQNIIFDSVAIENFFYLEKKPSLRKQNIHGSGFWEIESI